jgi:hypothetical protein
VQNWITALRNPFPVRWRANTCGLASIEPALGQMAAAGETAIEVRTGSATPGISEPSWPMLCTITALAAVLRLIGISRYGFDGDELFSLRAAGSSWAHLLSTSVHDKSHPPLFYAALKLWNALGPTDEAETRLLSVSFGVALIPVAYAICRQLQLRRADAAVVLILIATNGLLISLSQHTRMFALLDLTAAFSILCFIRFVEAPFSWEKIIFLTAANILLVYSHYWGWLVLAAQVLLVCLQSQKKKAAVFLLSAVVVATSYLPWALMVAAASRQDGAFAGQIAWMGSGTQGVADYAILFGMFNGLIDFPHATTVSIILFMTPIFFFTARWVKNGTHSLSVSRSPLFWEILVLTPLLLTSLLGDIANQNLWAARHLSVVVVSYLILVGLSVAALPSRLSRVLFRCALVAWATGAAGTSLARTDAELHWEAIAQAITARSAVPIYAADSFITCPLQYHLVARSGGRIPTVEQDLKKLHGERFWFVYRDVTWHGEDPVAQFEALDDRIEARISTRTPSQEVTALLVSRDAATAMAGASPDEGSINLDTPTARRKEHPVSVEKINGCYRR